MGSVKFQDVINGLISSYNANVSDLESSIRAAASLSFKLNLFSAFMAMIGLFAQIGQGWRAWPMNAAVPTPWFRRVVIYHNGSSAARHQFLTQSDTVHRGCARHRKRERGNGCGIDARARPALRPVPCPGAMPPHLPTADTKRPPPSGCGLPAGLPPAQTHRLRRQPTAHPSTNSPRPPNHEIFISNDLARGRILSFVRPPLPNRRKSSLPARTSRYGAST